MGQHFIISLSKSIIESCGPPDFLEFSSHVNEACHCWLKKKLFSDPFRHFGAFSLTGFLQLEQNSKKHVGQRTERGNSRSDEEGC